MRKYMLARYHARREEAIRKLGGKCIDCGTSDDLEFDHADSQTKEHDLAKIWSYKQEKFDAELSKCVIRCHVCHVEKSRQYDWHRVDHGGGMTGKRGCKCEPCRKRKAEYSRNYKRKARLANSIGRVAGL